MSGELSSGPYRAHLLTRREDEQAWLVLQQAVAPGERLLWAGRPIQGPRLVWADVYLIPFSFLWGGFAIAWEVGVFTSGAPLLFKLWGLPFVLVGLYLMVGRFFFAARRRARTYYGVTDRRALIVEGRDLHSVTSLDHGSSTKIELREGFGGRGLLRFGEAGPGAWMAADGWPSKHGDEDLPTFERIRNVRAVYELLRQAQRDLEAARAGWRLPR